VQSVSTENGDLPERTAPRGRAGHAIVRLDGKHRADRARLEQQPGHDGLRRRRHDAHQSAAELHEEAVRMHERAAVWFERRAASLDAAGVLDLPRELREQALAERLLGDMERERADQARSRALRALDDA
jgi:hypothetical protein